MGLFSAKPSENAKKIMEFLGCECDYYPEGKPAQLVHGAYEEAFANKEMGGNTPVVIVVNDVLTDQLSQFTQPEYREKLLADDLPDVQQWFTERLTEMKESYGDYWDEITAESDIPGAVINKLNGFVDFGTKRSQEVIIAKIPTENPWEVFAWVPFGGWNECPEPLLMMSAAKYWFEKFGAVPAVISHDILEFAAQPVRDRSAAVGLALEQYAFCNDIVDQGFQQISPFADTLMKSSVWSFWWD